MHSNNIQMPSAAKLKAWKEEHGSIFKISLSDGSWCIVRKPTIDDISMSATLGNDDETKMGKLQLENCWLTGDESIKTDFSKTLEAAAKMSKIFKMFPASKLLVDINEVYLANAGDLKDALSAYLGKQLFLIGVLEECEDGSVITHQAYFKAADEDIRSAAISNTDFLNQATVYAQSCFVAGADLLNSGDEVKLAALFQCHSLFVEYESTVEKL